MYRESRSGQLDKASAARIYMQQAFIAQQLASQLSVAHPLLAWNCSKEIKACQLDILHYKGDALGWPFLKPLTLSLNNMFFYTFSLMGIQRENWDPYILKIVIHRGIQGVLAQTSLPACTTQRGIENASNPNWRIQKGPPLGNVRNTQRGRVFQFKIKPSTERVSEQK